MVKIKEISELKKDEVVFFAPRAGIDPENQDTELMVVENRGAIGKHPLTGLLIFELLLYNISTAKTFTIACSFNLRVKVKEPVSFV